PSSQAVPGMAEPFGTPLQSSGTGVPTHSQSALSTSLIVAGFPSSQEVPGSALPPGVPLQSSGWPTQLQFAFQVSLPVFALPSSQAVPSVAGPFSSPLQSSGTGVSPHSQSAFSTSLIVAGLPS